jgi:hypothetical protein
MGYAILCPDDGICSIEVRSASIIEKWEETFRSIRFFCQGLSIDQKEVSP